MPSPRSPWINATWINLIGLLLSVLLIKVTSGDLIRFDNHRPRFKCTKCQPGFEVVKYCTETQDTICQRCPYDKFSPRASRWHHCRDCKICGNDEYKAKPCSPKSNTVCSPCTIRPSSNAGIAIQEYMLKCNHKSRHGDSLKRKRQLKRSNPSPQDGATPPPAGKEPPLDGPKYKVVDQPKTKSPEKKGDDPPVAAPSATEDKNGEADDPKDEDDGTTFIIIGSVIALVLILIAIGLYVGRRKGLIGGRHLPQKVPVDIEEPRSLDEKPTTMPNKMPSAEPLRDDREPLVVPEISSGPVMSAPPVRARTHVPNGSLRISFANGPGVRPSGSEDFPFIDDDDVDDDVFQRGFARDSDPKTKSLDRDSGTKSASPPIKAPSHSLPVGISPSSMKSFADPVDVDRADSGRLSPTHSESSRSSCYSLHSRHKSEPDVDEETSPLLRAEEEKPREKVKADVIQPELAPLMASSPDKEEVESDSTEEGSSGEEDPGTYLYAQSEPREALILDDDVEPRTMTELERQFDQMAADWAAFTQDNPGMGTCLIFEDPSLETIPESPEFSYNSAEDSVKSFGANEHDSDSSGEASITKSMGGSSSSSGNLDCVVDFKTAPSDRARIGTPSPDLDEELNSVPEVGDRDSMLLDDNIQIPLLDPKGASVPREVADSTRTSGSCAANMAEIQQYLGGSSEDEIFIPQADESNHPRNETVTSTDLERQLASVPAFQDSEEDDAGSDDAFHPNGASAHAYPTDKMATYTEQTRLHISSSESSSSSSDSSTEDSSSDDASNNNGVGLIFENKMAYR